MSDPTPRRAAGAGGSSVRHASARTQASICGAASLLAAACLGTPSPLAPGLHGSVGVPHHGVLTVAEELPVRGRGFARYREHGTNYWGSPRLVRGLIRVAQAMADVGPEGAPLIVGDLSSRSGGRIAGHRSHRTGRDVDLIPFVSRPDGASARSPGFVHFGPDGLARVGDSDEYVRLDVARNWTLVRTLVSDLELGVQLLLVSSDIEALLIDYALARGEPFELVWRAEAVMLEPTDSTRHDDHFHLRIACSPEEAAAGCEGGGPQWSWLWPEPASPELGPEELARIAQNDPLGASE